MQNKKKKRQLIIAFNKIFAVIASCKTDEHILSTLVMLNNYRLFFGTKEAEEDYKFFKYKLLNKEKEITKNDR